jgi:hypothetical protein
MKLKGWIKNMVDLENKFILDACCGGRLFWFNKEHPNAIYIDKRIERKGYDKVRHRRNIIPDIVMDFRKLDLPSNFFKLVVMDPPHLIGKENSCSMIKAYGCLDKNNWAKDIKQGFDECWRVLEPNGVLIFKWNESSISKEKLLKVLNKDPLFGHPVGSKIPTHWFCFMKIFESERQRSL